MVIFSDRDRHLLIEFPSVHVVLRSDAQALLLDAPERHSLRRIILAATTVMSSRTDHQQDRKDNGDVQGSQVPQSRARDDATGGDSQPDASAASATFASKRKSAHSSGRNVSGPRQSPQLAEKRFKAESAPIAAVETAAALVLAPPAARTNVQQPTVAHIAAGTPLSAPLLIQQQQQPYQQHQQQPHFQQQQQGPVHYASPAAAAAAALSAFASNSAPSNQYPQPLMYSSAVQQSMYQPPYQNMSGLHFAPYHQMRQQQFLPRPGFPHTQFAQTLPPPAMQAGMFSQARYAQNQALVRPPQ